MAISHKMYLPKIYPSPPAQKILQLSLLQVWRSFKLTLPDNIEQLSLLVFLIHRSSLGSCDWSICNHCCSWMLPCCWRGLHCLCQHLLRCCLPPNTIGSNLIIAVVIKKKNIIVSNSNCESLLIFVLIM